MTDTTKNPVSVRAALEEMYQMTSRYVISDSDYGIVCNAASALAAIQHSEQRETVPAGEGTYKQGWNACLDAVRKADDPDFIHRFGSPPEHATVSANEAPVAAPAPEAKAEQVTRPANTLLDSHINYTAAILHEAPACNPMGGEMRAYKHEASELPKWIDAMKGKDPTMDGVIQYIETLLRQSAPPIAVQGSITPSYVAKRWIDILGFPITSAELSTVMSIIDSRSPVAAAPEKMPGSFTSAEALFAVIDAKDHATRDAAVRNAALEEAAKVCDIWDDSYNDAGNCAAAIRALSAAAPSADAKDSDD